MKRLILFLIAASIIGYGCSKDNTAPSFDTFDVAKKAQDVTAAYNNVADEVIVTWDMPDTASVTDYYISISDSSVFDEGRVVIRSTNSSDTTYNFTLTDYLPAEVDSAVIYFDVAPVYKNTKLNYFIGPRSGMPDSCLIKR